MVRVLVLALHLCLFLNILSSVFAYAINEDKLVVTMDFNRKNPWPQVRVVHGLLQVKQVKLSKQVPAPTQSDIVSFADYDNLLSRYAEANVSLPSYVTGMERAVKLFNDKLEWKNWMKREGLSEAVAKSFDTTLNPSLLSYPVIMKTSAHGSGGVFIIHNASEYRTKSTKLKSKKISFSLEEPLVGLGMSEVAAFGSAYNGKLLFLRCTKRTFNSSVNSVDTSTGIFVSNVGHKFDYEEDWVACGKDLVRTIERMASAANISGLFCSNIKFDSYGKFKLMETNLRICATNSWVDGLMAAGYVTMAFEIEKAAPSCPATHLHHALYHGNFSRIYHNIGDLERRIIETGGGQQGGSWVVASHFNPNVVLDPIGRYYNTRNIFSGVRIIVAVAETQLMERLQNLLTHNDQFAFFSLKNEPLRDDVDLVVSMRHKNWSASLLGENIPPHLLPLVLTQETSERLGFVAKLRKESSTGQTVPASKALYGSAHKGKILSLRCVEHQRQGERFTLSHYKIACNAGVQQSVKKLFAEKGMDYSGAFCGSIENRNVKSIREGLCPAVAASVALFVNTFVPLARALREPGKK